MKDKQTLQEFFEGTIETSKTLNERASEYLHWIDKGLAENKITNEEYISLYEGLVHQYMFELDMERIQRNWPKLEDEDE
jgi:hypothetical protein